MLTVDAYLEAKRVGDAYAGKKASAQTLKSYRMVLNAAERIVGKGINEFTPQDVSALLSQAHEQYSQASINLMLVALKGAYTWGIETNRYQKKNPFSNVKQATPKRKIPTILNYEQMQCLIAALDKQSGRKYSLIASLMAYSGLRIAEATSLRKDDLVEGGIRIQRKGGKHAYVPLRDDVFAQLTTYAESHQLTDFVFYSDGYGLKNQPISATAVSERFKQAVKECGLPSDITPHSLRHSFATHALKVTKRLEVVQDFLGHADPKTTRFYAQVNNEELREEYDSLWD